MKPQIMVRIDPFYSMRKRGGSGSGLSDDSAHCPGVHGAPSVEQATGLERPSRSIFRVWNMPRDPSRACRICPEDGKLFWSLMTIRIF